MSLTLVPCTLKQANAFVHHYHRHHKEVQGTRLVFAVARLDGTVCGVALVGRPVARHLDDKFTLEVNRVCTDGTMNACSFLYGAAWKAARAIGYRRLITYTLPEEGGASLRAVGWLPIEDMGGGNWNTPGRPRTDTLFVMKKTRWEVSVAHHEIKEVIFPVEREVEGNDELSWNEVSV